MSKWRCPDCKELVECFGRECGAHYHCNCADYSDIGCCYCRDRDDHRLIEQGFEEEV